jgi:hypothetical protein
MPEALGGRAGVVDVLAAQQAPFFWIAAPWS